MDHFELLKTIPNNVDISQLKGILKFGIDPTGPDLHLGHLIPIKLIKKLKQQGCQIHIILGTFTSILGDPSGQDQTRPILTSDQTKVNADKILSQITRILGTDINIHKNHEWFNKMTLPEILSILSKFNLNHLLSRDAFQKRISDGNSIGMHELIVPLLQGLDSVELKAEIEIGGIDQLFNFHLSREVQEIMGQKPETCLMSTIINGTDGRKMSKNFGNCIFINDTPKDVFGKVMSIPDKVMFEWFPLFFDFWDDKNHPMELKKDLATKITEEIWSEEDAMREKNDFENTFQKKIIPTNIKELSIYNLFEFVIKLKNTSKSEARRLIDQNAVSVNDERITNLNFKLNPGDIVKIGKRDFGKVI